MLPRRRRCNRSSPPPSSSRKKRNEKAFLGGIAVVCVCSTMCRRRRRWRLKLEEGGGRGEIARAAAEKARGRFSSLDTDRDDRLSRQEVAGNDYLAAGFERLDRNGDVFFELGGVRRPRSLASPRGVELILAHRIKKKMSRWRLFIALLVALWLPFEAAAALAASLPKRLPSWSERGIKDCHDFRHHTTFAHEILGATFAHGDEMNSLAKSSEHGQTDRCTGDCQQCGLCQFVFGGVPLSEGQLFRIAPSSSSPYRVDETRFFSHIPDPLRRPPRLIS